MTDLDLSQVQTDDLIRALCARHERWVVALARQGNPDDGLPNATAIFGGTGSADHIDIALDCMSLLNYAQTNLIEKLSEMKDQDTPD